MSRRRIVLLGATGSIGTSALRVIAAHPDRLELVGIAARSRLGELADIARRFGTRHVGLFEPGRDTAAGGGAELLPAGTRFYHGVDGITELAAATEADIVLVASSGTAALRPTLAAIQAGRTIALANKEILVLAGALVTQAARARGVRLIPVDSEHNAIFQCLDRAGAALVRRLILTASGGAFRDTPECELAGVTPEQALAHPNWSMGPKITIDSATMANKGLEVIEARWLFDVSPDQIDVVIHPQSIVHSMVEYVDGSILAQLSPPSMTFAIQHALLHPDRAPGVMPSLDFSGLMRLEFRPCETSRFPCLALAREALAAGGTATAVYNAANEVAVAAFLERRLPFLEIPAIIRKSLGTIPVQQTSNLEEILAVEQEARATADRLISR